MTILVTHLANRLYFPFDPSCDPTRFLVHPAMTACSMRRYASNNLENTVNTSCYCKDAAEHDPACKTILRETTGSQNKVPMVCIPCSSYDNLLQVFMHPRMQIWTLVAPFVPGRLAPEPFRQPRISKREA